MPDLVIKNSRLVLPGKIVEAGLVIDEGKIKKIAADVNLPKADKVVDANGNYVLPGLIDVHVHLREPGSSSKEDWITGTSAAAAGGVTTVLDMPNTQPPTTTIEALNDKRAIAESKAKIDYGFHFGVSLDNLEELHKLEENIASVKFYMSVTTGNLRVDNDAVVYEGLKILTKRGLQVTTHAENRDMIHYWLEKLRGEENPTAVDYAEYRPNICAAAALNQMIYLSKMAGNRIHFCHVSTKEEADILKKSKVAGITSEVTPHHLFLSKDDIKNLGNYSKVNPPLRSMEDQKALWKAVHSGVIDIIATDHAPHLQEEKEREILSASAGMPGLETLLPLLLNEVNKGKLDLVEVARLTAQNPARIFRIAGKGGIVEGYDADLVIVDLKKEAKVENEKLFTKCGWSPFNGWKLKGWPLKTFVRGNQVFEKGVIGDFCGREITYRKNEK